MGNWCNFTFQIIHFWVYNYIENKEFKIASRYALQWLEFFYFFIFVLPFIFIFKLKIKYQKWIFVRCPRSTSHSKKRIQNYTGFPRCNSQNYTGFPRCNSQNFTGSPRCNSQNLWFKSFNLQGVPINMGIQWRNRYRLFK